MMSNVFSRQSEMDMTLSKDYSYSYRAIFSIFVIVCILAVIGKWNRHVFAVSNLPYLLLILIWFVGIFSLYRIPKDLLFSGIVFSALIFVLYMYIRIDGYEVPAEIRIVSDWRSNGLLDIAHQLIYYGLFLVSALLYYKKGFSTTLWFVIMGYLAAFMLRNSTPDQWIGMKTGGNLSPAYCVFPLMPFVFFKKFREESVTRFIPHIIFWICALWILALRARGAGLAMLVFYGCILLWPKICNRKLIFSCFFIVVLIGLITLISTYVFSMTRGSGLDSLNEISKVVFQKKLSRFEIWTELWPYISDRFLFGYGTESASESFAYPRGYLRAGGLSAHSIYFELMLRFGIVGFVLYFFMLFNIWKTFWHGRKEWVVRAAGSFLIATFFFMATAPYLIFQTLLRNGFGWIALGIGVGASLKVKNRRFNEVKDDNLIV